MILYCISSLLNLQQAPVLLSFLQHFMRLCASKLRAIYVVVSPNAHLSHLFFKPISSILKTPFKLTQSQPKGCLTGFIYVYSTENKGRILDLNIHIWNGHKELKVLVLHPTNWDDLWIFSRPGWMALKESLRFQTKPVYDSVIFGLVSFRRAPQYCCRFEK